MRVIRKRGSIQVSGDVLGVWVGAGLGLPLGPREGRVDTSPETWNDPQRLVGMAGLLTHRGPLKEGRIAFRPPTGV